MMFDSFQAVKRVQLRRSWRTRRHGWTGVGKGPCCTSRGSWENGGRHRRSSVAMLWVRTVYSCNNQSIDDKTLMLWLRLRLFGFDTKDTTKTTTRGTVIVLAFDFCRFCVVIRFFHFSIPATTAYDFRLWRIFYPRFYPLHLFSHPNSLERAGISIFNVECQTRELLVPFLLRLWYDSVLVGGLNPALEASSLPLGYRGGGCELYTPMFRLRDKLLSKGTFPHV